MMKATGKNAELKKAISDVLSDHYGLDNIIPQKDLLHACKLALPQEKIDSRKLRDTVFEMRCDGILICSLSGKGTEQPGYFLPASLEEYERFRNFYGSYAKRIFEALRAMDPVAKQEFAVDLSYQPLLLQDLPEGV